MRIQKECMICYQSIAQHECMNCGAVVCETCYDAPLEVCINCKSQIAGATPGTPT